MSNGFQTQVPQPYFGPLGVVLPTEDAILTGVQADVNTALGGNINPQLTNPTGQISTTETAVIGDSLALWAWFCQQVDPALNEGRMQDAIGRLYFMTRISGKPTVQPCTCVGLNTTPIDVGALAQDLDTGLYWVCQQAGRISASGSITLNFSCAILGPTQAPASLVIAQAIYGWESVTPSGAAVLGQNVETPAQYEARRRASVAANANQVLDAIQGQVLALPGVLDAYCYENDATIVAVVGGVVLGPNSIYICVLGGEQASIASAIWSKKGPGCGYNGNTFTLVSDPNPAYSYPPPSYSVRYTIPTIMAFVVLVVIQNSSAVPSNALTQIQLAIIAGFAGLDGGPRAKIGSQVLASRYYGDVLALGYGALIDIQIGILGSGATFTGTITGTTLSVIGVASGIIESGQILQDAGVLASGTLVVEQLTGTVGGIGTYRVAAGNPSVTSQTVPNEVMTATNLVNSVQMNINQAPAVSAGNINLALA